MSWFKFNDISSDDLGLIIRKTPFRPSWAEETEEISIPGCEIKRIKRSGIYGSEDITIDCVVKDMSKIRDIYSVLRGNGKLILSTSPDEYMNVEVNPLIPQGVALNMAELPISFKCSPFAYAVDESPVTIGASPTTVINKGTFYSEPIIKIKMPKGSDTEHLSITTNGNIFTIAIPEYARTQGSIIIIDSSLKMVYYATVTGVKTPMSYGSARKFPLLHSGENTVQRSFDQGAPPEYVDVYPNSRWI